MIRRASDRAVLPGRYNGLGGHVEPREDLRTAARREIAEEAGVEPQALRLAGLALIDTRASPGVLLAIFVGEAPGRSLREAKIPEGTLEWVPVERVLTLPVAEDFPFLWPRVLRFRETGEPFFLSYAYDDEDRLIIREG